MLVDQEIPLMMMVSLLKKINLSFEKYQIIILPRRRRVSPSEITEPVDVGRNNVFFI